MERMILKSWCIEMETAKILYMMTHGGEQNQESNNDALQKLDHLMESMLRKLKLFNRLLVEQSGDEQINQMTKSIRDIFLGLSKETMESPDLRIRLRSMTIWSCVLSQHNILPLIGYDGKKDPYAQGDIFVSVVIGIMKVVLNHFRLRFHNLKSFETEQVLHLSKSLRSDDPTVHAKGMEKFTQLIEDKDYTVAAAMFYPLSLQRNGVFGSIHCFHSQLQQRHKERKQFGTLHN